MVRGSIADGLDAAVATAEMTKIYPLAKKDSLPEMEFIYTGTQKFNTVQTNDFSIYEHLDKIIQYEPLDSLDMETRGLFASIGIEKGKPFAPGERMTRIHTDAVAIGNASARSIVWHPRTKGTLKGIELYQGD